MNSVRVTEGIRGPLGWLSVIAPKTDNVGEWRGTLGVFESWGP